MRVGCPGRASSPGLAASGLAAAQLSGQEQGLGESRPQVRQFPGVSLPQFPHLHSRDLRRPSRGMMRTGQEGDTEQRILTRATAADATCPPAGTHEKVLQP